MPRLDQREQQADNEKRPPIREKDARLAEVESAREESGGHHEEGYLDAPEKQI